MPALDWWNAVPHREHDAPGPPYCGAHWHAGGHVALLQMPIALLAPHASNVHVGN